MKRQRISWGTGLVVAVAFFLSGILALVVVSAGEDVGLVHPQYFDRGQHYSVRLRAMERAEALPESLTIRLDHGNAIIAYPRTAPPGEITGTVTFYRPSSGSLDRTLAVEPDSSWSQTFPVGGLARGLWKIQVEWKIGGEVYYREQPVMLQ